MPMWSGAIAEMARPFAPTLSRMLTRMNMLVSGAALVCSCLALGAYDLVTFRYALEQQLSIQAQIAGANSISHRRGQY